MRIPENRLSFSLIVSLIFSVASPLAFAQGARIRQTPTATDSQGQQPEAPPASNSERLEAPPATAGGSDADSERRESDGDHPAAREDWFRSGRRAMGEHAADLLHRAYVQKQSIRASQSVQRSAANGSANTANGFPLTGSTFPGTWTNLGPAPITSDPGQDYGPVVGRVTSVAIDQGDTSGNTVYIGAAFGGVWKSTNAISAANTVTWTPLIDDQPTLAVGAITIQPGTTEPNAVVLVGTGESNSSGDSYYGMGILRSVDSGKTWTLIRTADSGAKTFSGLGATGFAWSANPATPNVVVVGMGSTNGKHEGSDSVGGRGIYYSLDAGMTWHYAIVADPGVLSEGTVTAVIYNPVTQKFYAAYRYHGIYESSDGINWTRSVNQPDAANALTISNCPTVQVTPNPTGKCPLYRGQFAVQPVTNTMYAVYVDANDLDQGVYVSSVMNGVLSWQQLRSGPCKDPATPGTCPAASAPIWNLDPTKTGANPGIEETGAFPDGLRPPVPGSILQGDYNLWIGAVPNGAGTDLYVGTRNIYKCSVGSTNNCSTANAWKNLTFVYGFGCTSNIPVASASHVHPDQHAFDFSRTNPMQMYFVNDGGVYRSLIGTSSSNGTCTSPNPFDNLDANLGSVSEMVSFSQHSTNANVLLGGLQDNGSPALLGSGGPLWKMVNGGDGGYNEIDLSNPDGIWYVENPFVSIQQCDATNKQASPNGPNIPDAEHCIGDAFGAPPYPSQTANIGPPQVAGDTSEFYMPFILDAADGGSGSSRDLILGTCRVWRGAGVGGGTWVDGAQGADKNISPVFDSSATAPCANFSTKIRALAAGGTITNVSQQDGVKPDLVTPNFVNHTVSRVIYVGLEGAGTATASGNNLGQVWVNTNADSNFTSGLNGWHEIDQNANIAVTSNGGLGPYPISDIQIDPHDPTGQTAYVAVEGFGVKHIWKTSNAGQGWTDLTNNLPDAPADSIAVDPDDANIVFLGTDIGAFVTLDGGATWEILGTNLPNVPVTKLRIFESNGIKMLRASTYGRGAWQFALPVPPLVISPSSVALAAIVGNSSAVKSVTLTNNSSAALSVTGFAVTPSTFAQTNTCPSQLSANGSCTIQISFTPQAAGDVNGSLTFNSGSSGTTTTIALSGTGSDFNLAVGGSGPSATVNGGQAATYTLNVGGLDGFSGAVALGCTGLPVGANCSFAPATVNVSGTNVVPVTLTITTVPHSSAQPVGVSGTTSPFGGGRSSGGALLAMLLLAGGCALIARNRGRAESPAPVLALLLLTASLTLSLGCGGGGGGSSTRSTNTPPPSTPQTSTITVNATSGNRTQSVKLTLTVN